MNAVLGVCVGESNVHVQRLCIDSSMFPALCLIAFASILLLLLPDPSCSFPTWLPVSSSLFRRFSSSKDYLFYS
jgi:hypothetical protein